MKEKISVLGRKTLALVLCFALCLSMLPLGALAEGTEGEQGHTHVTQSAEGETAPKTAKDTAGKTAVPETTVPETTVPETTVPETTVPETTVPETTVPETTVPETTVPETTVPETTVPETTVPETTVPETTVPEADQALEHLKALLAALPETVAEENAEEVAAQLEAIAEAMEELTPEQLAQLDFTRFEALLTAWTALVGGNDGVTVFADDPAAMVTINNGNPMYFGYTGDAFNYVKNCTADDNASVKFLHEISTWGEMQIGGGVFTLDVAGYQINPDKNTGHISIYNATVMFKNTSSTPFHNRIFLKSGELTIAVGENGGADSITVNGGTLRVSHGTINNLTVNGGNIALSGGSYGSIMIDESVNATVADLLAPGYRIKDKTYAEIGEESLSNVQVEQCTAHSWKDGACEYCGMKCTHPTFDANGACTTCGQTYQASLTAGGTTTYYASLENALAAAQSSTGDTTVKVLTDVGSVGWPTITGNFTLNLNGKTVGGRSAYSLAFSGGEMTLTGGGELYGQYIRLRGNGAVIIPDQSNLSICEIIVHDNVMLTVSSGSIVILSVQSFTGSNVVLSGGQYSMIECEATYNGKAVTVADLLAPGYRIKGTTYAEICVPSSRPSANWEVENCTHEWDGGVCKYCGMKCSHSQLNENGTCATCGQTYQASLTAGDTTIYYASLEDALAAAQSSTAENPTVKLLADVTDWGNLSLSGTFTLDLNGQTMQKHTIIVSNGTVTMTGAGEIQAQQLEITNNGTLNISAECTATICGTVVKENANLNIFGGKTSWLEVWSLTGSNIALSGGKIESELEIIDDVNATIADLLAPGYRVKDKNYADICVKKLYGVEIVQCTAHKWENGACKYCNMQAVAVTPANSTVYLDGNTTVTLTATANFVTDAAAAKTYQWYEVGENGQQTLISGATESTYTCENLSEGTYRFVCAVTVNGVTETSAKATVTVSPRDIADAVITLGEQGTYTGSAQNVAIASVMLGETPLVQGTDYEILSGGTATDVEDTTLTIHGIGKYSGTATQKWSLRKAAVPDTYVKSLESRIYYGKAHTVEDDGTDNRAEVTLPQLPEGAEVEAAPGGAYNMDGSVYGRGIFLSGQTEIKDGKLYYGVSNTDNPVYAYIYLTVESKNYVPYEIAVRVNLVDITTVTFGGIENNQSFTYDGQPHTPAGTLTVSNGLKVDDLDVTYYRTTAGGDQPLPRPPKDAGTYRVVYSVPESSELYSGSVGYTFTVTPKGVTVSGITARNKEYDGGTAAELEVSNAVISGKVVGDDLSVASATGEFADASAGENKVVSITNLTLDGDDKANYVIAESVDGSVTQTTASITKKEVEVFGLGVESKTYDGSTAARVDYADVSLEGVLDADAAQVRLAQNATAAFDSASAGTSVKATVSQA